MNRPPEVFIRVDEERLLNFSIACFEKVGITHEHAALISSSTVWVIVYFTINYKKETKRL